MPITSASKAIPVKRLASITGRRRNSLRATGSRASSELSLVPSGEDQPTGDHGTCRSAQASGPSQLVADHRELDERRIQHGLLELGVALQHEAEDRGGEQQDREDRQRRVETDDRGEVGTLVVDELEEHPDGQAEERPTPLCPVERVD